MGLDERKALMQKLAFATSKGVVPKPQSKYDSISSMDRASKVEALKNNKLDPTQIKDPYDKLAHAFNLWKEVGSKAKANPNISFSEQRKIAENFYNGMIAPTYANDLKLIPMSKELWMKQAYEKALDYNIEDAYGNDWLQSLRHGWDSGLAATARAAGRITSMSGNFIDDAVALWHQQRSYDKMTPEQRRVAVPTGWHEQLANLHNLINTTPHEHSKLADMVMRGAIIQDENRQFWADAIPSRDGFLNKATDFTAEQVAQAPVFAAMELGGAVSAPSTLTARLSTSPIGRKAMGYLLAGGEGLAYGAAVHKQDDPGEAVRDAIGFAVFHGLFDVGKLGLKKGIDLIPADSKRFELMKRRQDELMLRAHGEKTASPLEQYNMHKAETANNLAVVGIPGQMAIHADALAHVAETENMGRQEVRDYETKLLKEDPARWTPVLSAARFIRNLVPSGVKISELGPAAQDLNVIREGLQKLTEDASSEMNTHVKGMEEISAEEATRNLKQPSAKNTLEFYVNKVQADLAKNPGAAAIVTKEQVQAAAEKMYAKDLQAAAEHSEKETKVSKQEKAVNISKRIKPAMKVRSERTVRGRDISVRYQVEPDYKVRLAEHKRAAAKAGKSLEEWFADLSDEDFEKDLSQYFYPKALKKAEVFFEHQNTREGMQNPNFLAFMHNYAGTMPPEFARELEERLMGTVKAQKYMNGRSPSASQLDYYAKAMYNHVDNFLGSGRWPKESNLFRTSNDSIFKTTKWQRELLIEKTVQERANLKDAFEGEPKALKSALDVHAAFAKARLIEFDQASMKRGSQDIIRKLDDQISDLITANKKYEKWRY